MSRATCLSLLLVLLCSSALVLGFGPQSAGRRVAPMTQQGRRGGLLQMNKLKDEPIPSGESDDQMRDRLRRKARQMMYNENGVAYAPWVSRNLDEDAIIEDLIRKEKGISNKKDKSSILERGEIQGSDGMRWRLSDGQVQLAWTTGGEAGNKGFIVEKKPSFGGDYQEIASFKEVAQLASKGSQGGKYGYTDPSTAGGSWIYRVKDCDDRGKKDVLCQCFVEVTTDSENKQQAGVLVGFLGVLGALAVAGVALNPSL